MTNPCTSLLSSHSFDGNENNDADLGFRFCPENGESGNEARVGGFHFPSALSVGLEMEIATNSALLN